MKAEETQNSWSSSRAQGDALTAKLFKLIHPSFGILKVQKLNNDVALPKRNTEGAAGYNLCASQNCTILAKGKGLVQIGLATSCPAGLYARIAPRSGLAVKKFIDVGGRVVDSDCKGDICVVLSNHGDQDVKVEMGDMIAEIVFEKIDMAEVIEVQGLEESVGGKGVLGSTRVKGKNDTSEKKEMEGKSERIEENNEEDKNETLKGSASGKERTDKTRKSIEGTSRLSRERQIISVKQLKRLVEKKTPFFWRWFGDKRTEKTMLQ